MPSASLPRALAAIALLAAAALPAEPQCAYPTPVTPATCEAAKTYNAQTGGVSLLVDTPFTYGDVLQLEDGTVCEVIELGLPGGPSARHGAGPPVRLTRGRLPAARP